MEGHVGRLTISVGLLFQRQFATRFALLWLQRNNKMKKIVRKSFFLKSHFVVFERPRREEIERK